MGQTITEKILSRVLGRDVSPGEFTYPIPDLTVIHDGYVVSMKKSLDELGVTQIKNSDRVMFVTDHEVVPVTQMGADRGTQIRAIAKAWDIKHFYDSGRGGIGHVAPVEDEFVKPGMLVEGYDTHVPNFGAIGALGIPILGEVTSVVAIGATWILVPETIRIDLKGALPEGVTVRDLGQYIMSNIDPEVANYTVFEFGGPAVRDISIDGRMTLCNVPLEIGTESIVFPTDEVTRAYYTSPIEHIAPDSDATYKARFEFDLSEVTPQISVPPTPETVVSVDKVTGKKIDYAFIGSCASGLMEDMRQAATILKGRKIHPDVRLFVAPATQRIFAQMVKEGIVEIFLDANCVMLPAGCGACPGGKLGRVSAGEVALCTIPRNDSGRLGSNDAEIYLGSALTVAASAVQGKISDCRELYKEATQ